MRSQRTTREYQELLGTIVEESESLEVLVNQLRQVINNLIDNSLKFTPAGGKVNITIDVDLLTKSACFSVRDTGVGIASDEKLQLFDRFYRGDHSRRRDTVTRGTGLGLSICQAIVKGHGGTLTIESQVGHGSC